MVEDASNFAKHGTDVLGTLRNLNIQQLLNRKREALLVGHHGDIIQSIEVRQSLEICAVLDELLRASVQQANVWIGTDNFFTIKLKNKS